MRGRADGIGLGAAAAIVLLAAVVMLPRLLASDFGLLDDGVSLAYGSKGVERGVLDSARAVVRMDGERGRFHPVHWISLVLQFRLGGYVPALWFGVNWLLLAVTGVLIARVVWRLSGDRRAAACAGAGYLLFPSVFEDYYTLSKSEPLLVLWLVISVWLLLESMATHGARKMLLRGLSVASVGLAYFTKETATAMVLIAAVWAAVELAWERRAGGSPTGHAMRLYGGANVAWLLVFVLARRLHGVRAIAAGDDSRQYVLSGPVLLDSTLRYAGWLVRDHLHVLVALAFLLVLRRLNNAGRRGPDWLLVIGTTWIAGSIVVMLPWHSALMYYLLPMDVGAAIILGTGVSRMIASLRPPRRPAAIASRVALALLVPLAAVSCLNGSTNGRIQIAVDRANAAMVAAVAKAAPRDDEALAYFPADTEYAFELWLHLIQLQGRPDIKVEPAYRTPPGTGGADVVVVVPEIAHQPVPTVRIGVDEAGVRLWQERASGLLAGRSALVSHVSERVRLAIIALDRPILGGLVGRQRWERVFCSAKKCPTLDFREFEYGWRIYRVSR